MPDSVRKDGLFTAPVRVERIEVLASEALDAGQFRVAFRVRVRDAADRPCPDFAVEAELSGPERTATGQAATDLMGRIRFRMTGPAGTYTIRVTDVAAGGMTWDRDASQLEAHTTFSEGAQPTHDSIDGVG